MTDERIDTLVRRLDVPYDPAPSFVDKSLAELVPHVDTARRRDLRWLGRTRRNLQVGLAEVGRWIETNQARPALTVVVALALLSLALVAVLAGVGRARPEPFGARDPLVVSRGSQVLVIDVAGSGSTSTTILRAAAPVSGLSRSPDGRSFTFWTASTDGHRLEVADLDGSGRRELAGDLDLTWNGCIDVWSPDSRWLASEAVVAGEPAILVVEIATGAGRAVRPPDGTAQCPLWSPNGRSLAFGHSSARGQELAIIGIDGTGWRTVAGGLDGLTVSGANSWSPDGEWIYFDANEGGANHIFRAGVQNGMLERLTNDGLTAFAPALSPDGTRVSFITLASDSAPAFDLWVMNADGTEPRLVLEGATNDGWSNDGRWILAEWQPSSSAANGGLVVVAPSGGPPLIVLPFDRPCPRSGGVACVDGVGWGQPRP